MTTGPVAFHFEIDLGRRHSKDLYLSMPENVRLAQAEEFFRDLRLDFPDLRLPTNHVYVDTEVNILIFVLTEPLLVVNEFAQGLLPLDLKARLRFEIHHCCSRVLGNNVDNCITVPLC